MLPSGSLNPDSIYQMGHSFRTLDPYLIYVDRRGKMNSEYMGNTQFFKLPVSKVSMSSIKSECKLFQLKLRCKNTVLLYLSSRGNSD